MDWIQRLHVLIIGPGLGRNEVETVSSIMGAKIFKITNVPSSRYQKSDITIGFSDIELVRKSGWMSQKSSFFTIF